MATCPFTCWKCTIPSNYVDNGVQRLLFSIRSQHPRSIFRLPSYSNSVSQDRTGFTPLKASSFAFVSNYDYYILKCARGDHHPLVMHILMLNIMLAIPSFDQTVEYHSQAPCKHDTSGPRRLSNRDIVQHQNNINIMILHDSS